MAQFVGQFMAVMGLGHAHCRPHGIGNNCAGTRNRWQPFLSRDACHRRSRRERRTRLPDHRLVEDRRRSIVQATRRIGRILKTHHRGFCRFFRADLVASLCTGRPRHERRARIPESGDDVQVPAVQKPRARICHVGGTGNRMGRQRRAGCRRRALHCLHADALFRQRLRRSAGQPELGAALRDHRPSSVTQSRASRRRRRPASTPTPATRISTRSFIRACSIGAPRSSTACPT